MGELARQLQMGELGMGEAGVEEVDAAEAGTVDAGAGDAGARLEAPETLTPLMAGHVVGTQLAGFVARWHRAVDR